MSILQKQKIIKDLALTGSLYINSVVGVVILKMEITIVYLMKISDKKKYNAGQTIIFHRIEKLQVSKEEKVELYELAKLVFEAIRVLQYKLIKMK